MNLNKKMLVPLKIQLFAEVEGGNGGNGGETPKTYTESEMQAILKERDSLKTRNDELCKKEKEWKEKEKANFTDEQKRQAEQEEIAKRIAELEKENTTMKIAKELAVGGYEEKEITEITQHITNNDYTALCKTLSSIHKNLVEKVTKQVKAELQKSNKLPNGSTNGEEIDEDVQNIIDGKKAGNNKARDYYLKK